MPAFSVNIEEVVDYLGLERKPRSRSGASSFDVKCPFCDTTGYHMNINTVKNTYHCVKCMDSTWKNTGVLDLYGRVALGTPLTGSNSKELFKSLLAALGRDDSSYVPERYSRKQEQAQQYEEIEPAPDDRLDKVYTALMSLPYLQLSDAHTENLRKRGLTDAEIERNGYRSVTASGPLLADIARKTNDDEVPRIRKFYRESNIARLKNEEMHQLSMYSEDDIVLGLKIGIDIARLCGVPDHVPGFYKIRDKWAFRSVDCGILIPTRNERGQIVGMQTRRDVKSKNDIRYMTVSSKGLDGGVTTSIARTHFPLGQQITKDTTVILTEGPLKSDTALALFHQLGYGNIAFIALQGVNSTRELPKIAEKLKALGIKEVSDGFDIDKLVNPAVFRAMKTAQRILKEHGDLYLKPLLWDGKYARLKRDWMKKLCADSNLRWTESGNVYTDIVTMSALLTSKKIDYDSVEKDGVVVKERWNDKTKGIDDYLLSILEAGKSAAEM